MLDNFIIMSNLEQMAAQFHQVEPQIDLAQLKTQIKEINFLLKAQQKSISKIKKDIELRPTESNIAETLITINSGILIDPSLIKLLKTKQQAQQDKSQVRESAVKLSKKINQICQCLPLIMDNIRIIQKKFSKFQGEMNSVINQKTLSIQEQLDEFKTEQMNQNFVINEKLQMNIADLNNKNRELQTKSLWQINDCKLKIDRKINQQMLAKAMKEMQQNINLKVKEIQLKNDIDPDRILYMEGKIKENEKEFSKSITGCQFKIKQIEDSIQTQIVSKKYFADEALQIDKKLTLLNNNLNEMLKRLKQVGTEAEQTKNKTNSNDQTIKIHAKQVKKIKEFLVKIQMSEQIQEMLQKLSPEKLSQIDQSISNLQVNETTTTKELSTLKRQLDILKAKHDFVGILTPNAQKGSKISKEQVIVLINQFFVNNQFSRKIQNLQSQIVQNNSCNDIIIDLNKKLARIQKQSNYHNVIFQLKGLEEYIKKQILMMNSRVNQLELQILGYDKKRPQSSQKNIGLLQTKMSAITFKKLNPVSSVSLYANKTGIGIVKR